MSLNIKQISNFQLKSLRIAGFIEYIQQAAKLFKTFRESGEEGQSQLPEKVEAVYTPFVTGVTAVDDAYKQSRSSDYTQKIGDEDMRRDNLYKLLVTYLKTYLKFTFDAEKKEATSLLWNIVRKYNVNVEENYSEESGKLQQMLQELETNYQAEQRINTLGLQTLIAQLKAANEQVRALMGYRNDERMQIEKAALANARAEADQAYRDLVLALNASVVMDENPTRFDDLISQVNELIKYYRLYVVPKGGKKDEEESEEGGSTSNSGNAGDTGNAGNTGDAGDTGENNGGSSSGGDDANQ